MTLFLARRSQSRPSTSHALEVCRVLPP